MNERLEATLSLNDKISAVLDRVNSALEQTQNAMKQVDKASQNPINEGAFQRATGSIDEMADAAEGAAEQMRSASNVTNNYIVVMDGAADAVDEVSRAEEESGEAADKAADKQSKFGNAMKVVGAAAAATTIAVAGAAAKLAKDVIDSYGELEQNIGGSEAVFGKYAESIQKVGSEAYRNMGVSQSEYLANANKMAALFQGSGLSQAKSAEMTTKAMQRAADMASVMGIETNAAMEAVTGAAKGNYTMMDNLGVKMDATTLEAYAAAEKLDKKFSEMDGAEKADLAMKYFFENTKQYAGNFANEAVGTISGSMGMLKASYQDLIAGLGNPDADIQQLCENVVESLGYVIDNITPVLENIISVLPSVADELLQAVGDMLPGLLSTVSGLFSGMLSTVLNILPNLIPALVNTLLDLVSTVVESLPLFVDAAVQLVMALADGLADTLPELIPMAVEAVVTIAQGIVDNLPMILDAALQLMLALAFGLLSALPDLIAALPDIITGIVDFLIGAIPMIIDAGVQLLGALIDNSGSIITAIVSALPDIISGLVNGIISHLGEILGAGLQLFVGLKMALPMIVMQIITSIPEMVGNMIQTFLSFIGGFKDAGANLLKGLWNGISDTVGWVIDRIKGIGSRILSGIKSVLGIHSPSKETEWMGKMLGEGLANGITYSTAEAVNAAAYMANRVNAAASNVGAHMTIPDAVEGVTSSVIETEAMKADEKKAISDQDLNYMYEIAEREAVNRVTNKQINVDFSGMTANINNGKDEQDFMEMVRVAIEEAVDSGAEGED